MNARLERLFDEVHGTLGMAATAVSRLPWPEMTKTGKVGSRRFFPRAIAVRPASSPQPDVEQDKRGAAVAERRQRLAAIGRGAAEKPSSSIRRHEVANVPLVVDTKVSHNLSVAALSSEYPPRRRAAQSLRVEDQPYQRAAAGASLNSIMANSLDDLLTIASPRPVPLVRVV